MMFTKKYSALIYFFLILTFGCSDDIDPGIEVPEAVALADANFVHVDLNDRSNDTFKVTMFVDDLTSDQDIFQFPATIPGTYSISDVGRFVTNFEVFDKENNPIGSEQITTNQWKIAKPTEAYKIAYQISETFDTEVNENEVFAAGGTSIEEDHVLLNTPIAIGYILGLKERGFYFSASYPEHWLVGTALAEVSPGLYFAEDYDFFADSPFLFGELTTSSVNVGEAEVDVFVYSPEQKITASVILDDLEQIIFDAEAFLEELPTDNYTFLFLFSDVSGGALEHSYSSVYAFPDFPYSDQYGTIIKNTGAHEFFHIVTPLNIHSEIIANFNFATPVPSQHLWLYEGVTEWASDYMQYRNGSVSLQFLLQEMFKKVDGSTNFDENYSLTNISLDSYTEAGSNQFVNVYLRGAFVVSLLDIRLLELSDGKMGMREVVLDLINAYGPQRAFSEQDFFETLVNMTYPEIEDFINYYIKGTEDLPISEYYEKIGINYNEETFVFSRKSEFTDSQAKLFEAWSKNL